MRGEISTAVGAVEISGSQLQLRFVEQSRPLCNSDAIGEERATMSEVESVKQKPQFAAFIGIDWADKKHVWCLQAVGSEKRESGDAGVCLPISQSVLHWR